jgi:hypothetical protein
MKNNKVLWFYPLILMLSTIVFLAGCKEKEYKLPTVITSPVTVTSSTSATSGGTVTDDGGIYVTERGIYWAGPSNEPDCADFTFFNGAGNGVYTSEMKDLEPNKTYLVRAYAKNYKGTAFGEMIKFTTAP